MVDMLAILVTGFTFRLFSWFLMFDQFSRFVIYGYIQQDKYIHWSISRFEFVLLIVYFEVKGQLGWIRDNLGCFAFLYR
jgi:hypothetical protein